MKKIILSLAVVLFAASASAQNWVNEATDASKWSVGIRLLDGFQASAEYKLSETNYIEGRFGTVYSEFGGVNAHFGALYNWHLFDWDWTPNAGIAWFLDAGCGVGVGGHEHYAYVGVAGQAKFGIKFKNAPFKIAIDWTPCIGPDFVYGKYSWVDTTTGAVYTAKRKTTVDFNEYGLCDFGISFSYCF